MTNLIQTFFILQSYSLSECHPNNMWIKFYQIPKLFQVISQSKTRYLLPLVISPTMPSCYGVTKVSWQFVKPCTYSDTVHYLNQKPATLSNNHIYVLSLYYLGWEIYRLRLYFENIFSWLWMIKIYRLRLYFDSISS